MFSFEGTWTAFAFFSAISPTHTSHSFVSRHEEKKDVLKQTSARILAESQHLYSIQMTGWSASITVQHFSLLECFGGCCCWASAEPRASYPLMKNGVCYKEAQKEKEVVIAEGWAKLEKGNLRLPVAATLQSYFLTDFHSPLALGLVPGLDTKQACPLPPASVV